jgi:hypothetical protein
VLEDKKSFGNIRLEEATCLDTRDTLAVVRRHKNPYYGLLDEYLASGWTESGPNLERSGCLIPRSLFGEEEAGYTVAFVHLDTGAPTTRLESVEDRMFFLPESEYSDFFKACIHADLALLRRSA